MNYLIFIFFILLTSIDYMCLCTLEKKKPSQKVLKRFANEVADLIRSKPEKQLAFHNLSSEYHKYYKKHLKLSDFGFTKLNDLVSAISDYVEVQNSCLTVFTLS